MTIAIIAVKGDQLDQNVIFNAFNYNDLNKNDHYNNLDEAVDYLFSNYLAFSEQDIALWTVWVDSGWTLVYDPEMVNLFEEEALLSVAGKLDTDVFTFIIQSTSNSFGFAKYSHTKERQFISVDGNVTENIGSPMPEESGLNINDKVFIDDIIKLAQKIGVDIKGSKQLPYTVKQLAYNAVLKEKLAAFKQTNVQPQASAKPWWKFW